MTDQELNEAVSKKIGRLPCPCYCHIAPSIYCTCHLHHEWPYATSIEAAWEIVEYLTKIIGNGRLELSYDPDSNGPVWIVEWNQEDLAEADTAPRAICLAFLKLP